MGLFRVNWNLEMLVFEERGKPEYPEKNLSEQGREPTFDAESDPGHIGGRPAWETNARKTHLLIYSNLNRAQLESQLRQHVYH